MKQLEQVTVTAGEIEDRFISIPNRFS